MELSKDEIIRMAREAGLEFETNLDGSLYGMVSRSLNEELFKFASLISDYERMKQIDGDVCARCGGIVYDAIINQLNEKPVTVPANGLRQQEPSRSSPTGSQSNEIVPVGYVDAMFRFQTCQEHHVSPSERFKPVYTAEQLESAVLAEREACAKVCDDKHDYMCSRAAAAIRARGNNK